MPLLQKPLDPVEVEALNQRLASFQSQLQHGQLSSLSPLLPLIFRLRSKPYSLSWSHFMFEPFFRITGMPRRLILVCGRQVSKSTSQAAAQILRARLTRDYNILTVMPLFEQVRKFSQNYARPFLTTSPIRSKIITEFGDTSSVLQRSIGYGSNLFYSYSSGDPSRVRGIPADEINTDEVQDMDHDDLPVIEQCMGASPWKLVRLTGTPKTFDNTIHLFWEDSSQAHWYIPCICGHENRCAGDNLLRMVGDGQRNDGSFRTLICGSCGRQVNSRDGYFIHDYPDRQRDFAGYHVPQVILPMHYESPKTWYPIVEFRRSKPTYSYINEILGESYDLGAKLVTEEQLHAAAVVTPVEPRQIKQSQYTGCALGVDWGGRGKEKASDTDDFISNTAMALALMCPDGSIDIPWLYKVPYQVDQSEETEIAVSVARQAKCEWLALDYGGQGNVQEGQIRARGWPAQRTLPFTYQNMSPTRPLVVYNRPTVVGARSSYTLDKARSLLLLCELIKRGWVRLPKSDVWLKDHLRDFLNIYEESIETPTGSIRRLVKRMARRHDDVVHAINLACMALFHSHQAWPEVTKAFLADGVELES